jgi:hypothetical protein
LGVDTQSIGRSGANQHISNPVSTRPLTHVIGVVFVRSLRMQELMAYVGAAFGSANADVRGAALRVALVAAEAAGPAPVRRLLPQGMNPKMKEQVEQALGLDTTAPQPAGGC